MPDFTKQKELVDAYSARWRNLAEEMGAITFSARPQWRVIMGLGTNDILEGGIVLHPIFGFPTLPATSLKGVSRAYAQWVLERPEQELDALLGMVDEDESRCGDLVFLEGSPVTPPVLERDVVNPIFGPYYRDSKTPPANYLSPQPIFFLALNAGSSYQFGVASLSGDQTAARQGVGWLQGALIDLGVGASPQPVTGTGSSSEKKVSGTVKRLNCGRRSRADRRPVGVIRCRFIFSGKNDAPTPDFR